MINTTEIIKKIYDSTEGFAKTYRNSAPFIDSGELWDFCIEVIKDENRMSCIAFANEFGVPPVKSLLYFYEQDKNPDEDFRFDAQTSQWLGSLMGFVFKFCLGYNAQKERIQVNKYGVGTATKFLEHQASFKIA